MNKRKIKILFTIPNFDTAGSGKVLYDLAKNLDKNKFDVSIACRNSKGFFFKEVESLNLPIYFLEMTVSTKPYITFFSRIKPFKNFVKEHQFDIVHSWHWSSDWSEVIATRLAGAKYIYTKKAMSWGNIHWKIKSYLSNFIITINHEMINFFPSKKNQKLIPLGLDVTYYNPDLFPKTQDNHYFKIITVANLVPVKGIELIIKALSILKNDSYVFTVIGDDRDPYAIELHNLVNDLNLEHQIQFVGKKSDVRPFFADADLYIIPTLNDKPEQIRELARWVKANMGGETPLHFSRFFPRYKMLNLPPTSLKTLDMAREIALSEGLQYVYIGNIESKMGQNTYCPDCKKLLIERSGYSILQNRLKDGCCPDCGKKIYGVWK